MPAKVVKCPACGAKVTGAQPSIKGLIKARPWIGVLLAASASLTLWALTRRAPAPPPVSAAIEPAVEPVAPPEPEQTSEPAAPVFIQPPPEPQPEAAAPPMNENVPPPPASGRMREDGTFEPNGNSGPIPGR